MPKGFKTVSLTDECDKILKYFFSVNGKRNESFSRWLNDFIIKSVKKQIWNNYINEGLTVIDFTSDVVTIADINEKIVVTLGLSDSLERVYCDNCKKVSCNHCEFIHRTLFEIELLEKSQLEIYTQMLRPIFKLKKKS